MCVMFWLSRARLRWNSNCTSNDPTLTSPCTSCCIHFSISRIPEAHQAYCRAFELSTQPNATPNRKERFRRFGPCSLALSTECKLGGPDASSLPSRCLHGDLRRLRWRKRSQKMYTVKFGVLPKLNSSYKSSTSTTATDKPWLSRNAFSGPRLGLRSCVVIIT